MTPLKNLTTKVSIDGLGLSCFKKYSNNVYVGQALGAYHRYQDINLKNGRPKNNSGTSDLRGKNYEWLFKFEHRDSGNILNIYTKKIWNKSFIPAVYAFFLSSYDNPLKFDDVIFSLQDLCEEAPVGFHVSKIDLATDLILPNKNNLHKRVIRSINPIKKHRVETFDGTSTLYLGGPRSSNRVVVYDKGEQLREKKGIRVDVDISRIEIRMKMSGLKNRISALNQLRSEGWASFIYGKYFSLDRPRRALKAVIGEQATRMPLHKIKASLKQQNGKLPDNFHRDYIREHRKFGPAVRKALVSYKWN